MNTSIFFSISSYFTGRDKEELSASYSFSSRLCTTRRVWSQYHPTLQAETRRSEELSASYSFSSHGWLCTTCRVWIQPDSRLFWYSTICIREYVLKGLGEAQKRFHLNAGSNLHSEQRKSTPPRNK